MIEEINGYPVYRYDFSKEEIDKVSALVDNLHMNLQAANGTHIRSLEEQKQNKLMGFLAEEAVYNVLRESIGALVHRKETDLSNQIDLFIGTKTTEIRSSKVPDMGTALTKYHLVGTYTNSYKKEETVKDYYIWVTFDSGLEHCYIVGGATKKMIEDAPVVNLGGNTSYKGLTPDHILNFHSLIEEITPTRNERLSLAKQNKEDEFYTLYSTIDKELDHYKDFFAHKIIYLPCDNPDKSQFWIYFMDHFEEYKIKELRATYLNGSYTSFNGKDTQREELEEGGSFDTDECLDLFNSSDIIVTNPPFSLFRSFILQAIYYNKDFIILGNQNASTTKDIFPLFKANQIRYGYFTGSEKFIIPEDYETRSKNVKVDEEGNRLLTVEGIRWFTTFPVSKDNQIIPTARFSPFVYEQYDNYEAYEVSFVKDIPDCEYPLGVPISYLNVHNPNLFELIGTSGELAGPIEIDGKIKNNPGRFYLNGKRLYERIVIQKK